MNLLELVNRVRLECGVAGPQLMSLSSAALETQRIRNWVIDSWRDIQTMKDDWHFMQKSFQFATVAQQQVYTPTQAGVADFSTWKLNSLRCAREVSLVDEQLLGYMLYDQFRNLYQYGPTRTNYARPAVFTVTPQKALAFSATPDDVYQIVGEYYKTPMMLSIDTDSPEFPVRFHMLIVYMAMKHYGAYESAPEVYQRGSELSGQILSELMINELPAPVFGAPLA